MSSAQIIPFLQFIAVAAIPLLFGITLHEVAHGWMARRHGDRTAELLGRLSLNPLKHIDPVGTVAVPLFLAWTVGFMFGWAKPVPVNMRALNNPKRDMIWVALAGPGANLLMALGWTVLYKFSTSLGSGPSDVLHFVNAMARIGIFFNLILAIFNLLPIPPLDGGRVLRGLVPESVGRQLDAIERFGLIIVLGLLFLGLLRPVVQLANSFMRALGVPPMM